MEAERVMVHGIEVKPGQVWACAQGLSPSRVVSIGVKDGRALLRLSEVDNLGDWADWSPDCFARIHTHVVSPDAVVTAPAPEPASKEPERWTDARYAEEQVALARRQAEVARAEARELRVALVEAENRVGPLVAERDKLRADLDHLHVGTIDHERMAALEAELAEARAGCVTWEKFGRQAVERADRVTTERDQTRAALEAARAAVHTPSPGVDDRRWSHPARDEGPDQRLVDGIVDAASAARRVAPRVVAEGRDPATRTRALPVVPAQPAECWTCEHEAGSYCYHPAHPLPAGYREIVGRMPPDWCPIRSELAKAGGA